jgi:hypothetical protein
VTEAGKGQHGYVCTQCGSAFEQLLAGAEAAAASSEQIAVSGKQ